jgi:hypothetical protein
MARETDTGNLIIWDGSVWRRIFIETQTPNASGLLAMGRSAAADGILTGRVNGDANSRIFVDAGGAYWTGPGSATQDTRLRRSAAGEMTLDNGAGSGGVFVAANIPGVQKVVLGADTASITFSFTAGVFRTARIEWIARSTTAANATNMHGRINNNSTANYEYAVNEVRNDSATGVNDVGTATTFIRCGVISGSTANATEWGSGFMSLTGISGASGLRPKLHAGSNLWVSGVNWWLWQSLGIYKNAGPYTSWVLFPSAGNFLAGSEFFFEGIKVP